MAALSLDVLQPTGTHVFVKPVKKIQEEQDVSVFLHSRAYKDITAFITQLNRSMFPTAIGGDNPPQKSTQVWEIGSAFVSYSSTVQSLRDLLDRLEAIIEEAPPDTGPRRFGNVSFRKWYSIVEARISELLRAYLPAKVLTASGNSTEATTAGTELEAYLLGSFGSPQRLDYGTGHELSFVAFLACVWKLNGFEQRTEGAEERGIVLGLIEPYLQLIRRLIKIYTLEPAGSHGVWGLDDHSFVPYIFGSAQFAPAISNGEQIPAEGSLAQAPDPADVAKSNVVQRERKRNMYFSAVGFIYDVKKGPFWEHSPILFDISGIRAGWAKINKGMIKMFNVEVLSKFPVVQHFPFGSLLRWEQEPSNLFSATSPHTANHAVEVDFDGPQSGTALTREPSSGTTAVREGSTSGVSLAAATGTVAPWANSSMTSMAPPTLRGAIGDITASRDRYRPRTHPRLPVRDTQAIHASQTSRAVPAEIGKTNLPTRAPWASSEEG